MREFIEKTKSEKLGTIEEIIGFGVVAETRDALLKAVNALRDDSQLATLQGQREERKRDLAGALEREEFEDGDVLTYAETLAGECDPSLSIADDAGFQIAVDSLEATSTAGERGKELSALDKAAEEVKQLRDTGAVLARVRALVAGHNRLAKDRKTVTAAALERLYTAAIEAMSTDLLEPGECPICGASVDTGRLLASLRDEVAKMGALLTRRDKIVPAAKSLSSTVGSHRQTLDGLLGHDAKAVFLTEQATKDIQGLLSTLSACREVLAVIEASFDPVVAPPPAGPAGAIEATEAAMQARIRKRREELDQTDDEKEFYGRVHALRKLLDDHLRLKELTRQAAVYESQIESLRKAHDMFEAMERREVAGVLKAISADVNDFMTFLHPDDEFDEVELITIGRRGIEFKLKYHGQEVCPPMKILSEAHLNSLGICVFIASARHFNKTNGFLILDDVVTSFDSGHRRWLSRLLSQKLPETQILLFTHDDLWFDMLKKDLPAGAWLFQEVTKWTKESGVDLRDSPLTLEERIASYLATNDVAAAANKCRSLIEEILKEICERLGVRGLEFRAGRANDQRTAAELIGALTSYLKKNQSLRDKASKKHFDDLRATSLVANIGSHHRTLETTGLARGDIDTALADIQQFKSLFVCPECSTNPGIRFSPRSSALKQCQCGDLKI